MDIIWYLGGLEVILAVITWLWVRQKTNSIAKDLQNHTAELITASGNKISIGIQEAINNNMSQSREAIQAVVKTELTAIAEKIIPPKATGFRGPPEASMAGVDAREAYSERRQEFILAAGAALQAGTPPAQILQSLALQYPDMAEDVVQRPALFLREAKKMGISLPEVFQLFKPGMGQQKQTTGTDF